MTIDFYYMLLSAPCRSVMLTAKALGVDLNLKPLDLMKGEHLTPEFIEINPQHTIPTLVDNGFVVTESRAITAYLVEQYGKDDSLYPRDAKKRSIVNQRLYFDMGTLYQRFADSYYPALRGGVIDEEKKKKLDEAFEFLDKFLEGSKYVAGDRITIADFCLAATTSTIEGCGYKVSAYPNVATWLAKAKTEIKGYEEINEKGVELMKAYFESLKK